MWIRVGGGGESADVNSNKFYNIIIKYTIVNKAGGEGRYKAYQKNLDKQTCFLTPHPPLSKEKKFSFKLSKIANIPKTSSDSCESIDHRD